MVRKRAEGFVAKRDLCTELPGPRRVKIVKSNERHVLIDPTEPVDGDFLYEKLFWLFNFNGRLFNDECFWRHASPSNTSILPCPTRRFVPRVKDSEREQHLARAWVAERRPNS